MVRAGELVMAFVSGAFCGLFALGAALYAVAVISLPVVVVAAAGRVMGWW
jgi:hypothetical protein